MCANFPSHRAVAKFLGDGLRRLFGDSAKQTCVAGFNFISQGRSLAIRDGWIARRRGGADFFPRVDRYAGIPGLAQIIPDHFYIVISMRCTGQKTRRIIGKNRGCRFRDNVGKLVCLDPVPDAEDEFAAGLLGPPSLGLAGYSVWEKHYAELANDNIKCPVIER